MSREDAIRKTEFHTFVLKTVIFVPLEQQDVGFGIVDHIHLPLRSSHGFEVGFERTFWIRERMRTRDSHLDSDGSPTLSIRLLLLVDPMGGT